MTLPLLKDDGPQGLERPQTVLIVEDDEKTAAAWKDALEPDYWVSIATSPEVAIRSVGPDDPEILILDLELRDPLDGLDVAQRIIARFPLKSLIVVSARDLEAYRTKARKAGLTIADWLDKPPDWDRLTRVLHRESKKQHTLRILKHALEIGVGPSEAAAILALWPDDIVEQARRLLSRPSETEADATTSSTLETRALYDKLRSLYAEGEGKAGLQEEIQETLAEIRRRQELEAKAMTIYFDQRREYPRGAGHALLREARERLDDS